MHRLNAERKRWERQEGEMDGEKRGREERKVQRGGATREIEAAVYMGKHKQMESGSSSDGGRRRRRRKRRMKQTVTSSLRRTIRSVRVFTEEGKTTKPFPNITLQH